MIISEISPGGNNEGAAQTAMVPSVSALQPEDQLREEFRRKVREWLDIDAALGKMALMVKERKSRKAQLTDFIMAYMSRYQARNATLDKGKIQVKFGVRHVLQPLSQATIRQRLDAFLAGKFDASEIEDVSREAHEAVFAREKVDRASLRINDAKEEDEEENASV